MGKKLLTTDSTHSGYIIMSIVCTLYVYQESALNHMRAEVDLGDFSDVLGENREAWTTHDNTNQK